MLRAAVVLSGAGVFDGSEIHEAVATLYHLGRLGASARCFAPDEEQPVVVNHLTGKPAAGERRNMLVEAARIARGQIEALTRLNEADFDAVFFPGGFGAAKNLSDYATAGARCAVHAEVERIIREFHGAPGGGKPVGLCCIAPVLAARVLGGAGANPRVTVGEERAAMEAVRAMGATPKAEPVTAALVDEGNRLVTTPAYMIHGAPIQAVFEGIGAMVERTLELAAKRPRETEKARSKRGATATVR